MTQPNSYSWLTRVFAGAELDQKEQEHTKAQARLEQQEKERAEAQAELAKLKSRLDQVESELKVRTDIMNVTSIVSEADKKGDILSINEKFIEVSKYSRNELIGARKECGFPRVGVGP